MPPLSRTSRILLLAVAAIIVVAGYFWLRWWIASGERAPSDTQSFSEPEKLQVLQELSASAPTTASAQEKAKVLEELQHVSARTRQDSDLSDAERSAVLQALRAPN
jgi:hypothetical protein